MTNGTNKALFNAIRRILRPLARLLLKNGVAYADFATLARQVFVDVAGEDFDLPGRKQSVSRISVITGINRKEVKKLLEEPRDSQTTTEHNRAARVVGGWMRDNKFTDQQNTPKPLSLGNSDDASGFEELVKQYSGDMPARSILDELIRVGAAEIMQDNTVKLSSAGYVPAASNEELLRLSSLSVSDMLNTIEHNLSETKTRTRLQLSVAYDDVPASGVEMFRNLSKEKSRELLSNLDAFLATQDRSVNPAIEGEGRYRTGLGIYYFEEENPDFSNPETTNNSGVDKKQSTSPEKTIKTKAKAPKTDGVKK